METAESNRIVCFGDEVKIKAIKADKFPVTFGGVKGLRANIEADIFKNDSPLQLSHSTPQLSHNSLKIAGMLLGFKNDSSQILYKIAKNNFH